MTLIHAAINSPHPNSIAVMETQLMDDFDTSFLYEWKTAEEDLDFLDYTYCVEDNPNKRSAPSPTTISSGKNIEERPTTVLNISLEKLRRIEDPESCLRRTVLISNTIKRIRNRASSELKVLRDKEIEAGSCFSPAYGGVPKRPRLHVTDLLNSNNATTVDNLNGDYEDYQGLITKQDSAGMKEICNQKTIPVGNALCGSSHLPTSLTACTAKSSTTAEGTKRNCEPVRFNALELTNVICALET